MLKERTTYEIMRPEDVGVANTDLVLGKHSGRAALADRAKQLGYTLTGEELQRVFEEFKVLADRKKEVFDGDIRALIVNHIFESPDEEWSLVSFQLDLNFQQTPTIQLTLSKSGKEKSVQVTDGVGPVDVAFLAVKKITGFDFTCREYSLRSASLGQDANGDITILVEYEGELYRGQAVSMDCIEGSIKAILHAINRIISSKVTT
jgi:2-isopropylmalate synthase